MSRSQKIRITKQEGEALGQAYLQNIKQCFAANDFSSNRAFVADNLTWEWSGGVSGKGTQDDFYAVMAKTWQPLVSQFLPSSCFTVVDAIRGIIAISFDIVLVLDGRGAVPISPSSTWSGKNLFEIRVNADHKVTHFRGAFDSKDAHMQAAMVAIMKATKQTPPKQPQSPQIITRQEGEALAHKILDSMRTGFAANDFSENRKLLADKLSWDWSGDVSGKGSQDDYFKVLGASWQPLVSQFLPTRPYVVVDTAAGVISILFQLVLHIDGRGSVPISSTSAFVGEGNVFEFQVNAQHKVNRFRGLWNPANAELKAAIGAVMKANAPPLSMTQDDGVALAQAFLQNLKQCFAANDFSSNRAFLADDLTWEWSGGVSGAGTQDDYYSVLAKTWQPLVSQFLPSSSFTVVDTVRGIIAISFDVVLIMNGRGAVPVDSTSTYSGRNLFELRLNSDKKITHFRGAFDSKNPDMQAAIGAVMKATKQTPQEQPESPEIISSAEGEVLAHKLLDSMRVGFAANDFTENRKLLAKKVSWEWSGDVVGEGSQADYYKVLGSTWQPLVSQFLPTRPTVVVDSAAGVVSISFQLVCHIDGRGAVPTSSTSTFVGDGNLFEFQVNAAHKVTRFRGLWNPTNARMLAAIGAVMKAKAEVLNKQPAKTNNAVKQSPVKNNGAGKQSAKYQQGNAYRQPVGGQSRRRRGSTTNVKHTSSGA